MKRPTFHNYLKTLSALLKQKGFWLIEEAKLLAHCCLTYGELIGLTEKEKKTLYLAAYYKNLGALYISDFVLQMEFKDHGQMMTSMNIWFAESSELAREAKLTDVAVILEQYHRREIPDDKLASIFQVINTWVACHQHKGWRQAMHPQDALTALKQRAHHSWSDPEVVYHFIHNLDQVTANIHKLQPRLVLQLAQST